MAPERLVVRSCLTAIVVSISIGMLPLMLLLKLGEGFYASWKVGREAVRQVWSARGLKEFDS